MKGRWLSVSLLLSVSLVLVGCATKNDAALRIVLGEKYTYSCIDGTKIRAQFGGLSDDSLHFARISLPDGRKYTLPQLVSASGARYSDERELEFWIKGEAVTIRRMNEDGVWEGVAEGKTEPHQ